MLESAKVKGNVNTVSKEKKEHSKGDIQTAQDSCISTWTDGEYDRLLSAIKVHGNDTASIVSLFIGSKTEK